MAKRIEPLTLGPAKRGAGKYDDLATLVRQQAAAQGVVVIVIGGPAGSGFSVQAEPALLPHLVGLLRTMADAVEADLARPETAWTCPRCGVTRTVSPAGATRAAVHAPAAATTPSAPTNSPSTSTPVTRPAETASSARPEVTTAPLTRAALTSPDRSRLPSTRAAPPM